MNPAKPTKLKILQGNPGQRPINSSEPEPTPASIDAPAYLDGEALAEWERVAPALSSLGLLGDIDRSALIAYCEAWAGYRASMDVYRLDPLITGQKGNLVRNPAAQIARDSLAQAITLMREFGMTPSSRSRMSVPGADSKPDNLGGILSA